MSGGFRGGDAAAQLKHHNPVRPAPGRLLGFRGGDAAAQLKRVCLPDELPERPGFRGGGSIEAEIGEYLCEQFPEAGFRGGDAAAQLKRVEVARQEVDLLVDSAAATPRLN